ncbi:MAG: family 16 glycoside hydrolase [Pirellulales bacterium]
MTSTVRSLLLAAACCASLSAAQAEDGFEPIFDGRSLDGWLGQDMSFWTVEDGAITGTISPEHAPPMNQYLVWQRELVDDFELQLEFRLTGSTTPNTNGGFQFRSRRLPNGDVAGYQVDNNFGQRWKVRLYDEFGRHDLALEGERSVFDAAGQRHVEPLPLESGAADFKLDEWHAYHLTARGPLLELRINGKLVAQSTDNDPQQYEPLGVLAMQLHTGPPMKAQFRNLRIKRLAPAIPPTPRERLLATAALDWQLGERPSAHQPPLAAQGTIVAELPASGTAAHSGAKVARFEQAYVDGGRDWNTSGDAITVYLRARMPDGNWNHGLFAKRGSHQTLNFNLFGVDLPDTPGTDIGFEVHPDQDFYQASFPVSRIDAAAWHDLVARYDGRHLELLCDGALMQRIPARGALTVNTEPILIGAETDGGQVVRPAGGEFEEAAVWTRALSDSELRVLLGK